jgi:YgiT-type zinc finger domain-containing protein
MTCVICKTGHYNEGFTTVVPTKDESVIIIKQVPALVCDQCGEYILSEEITKKVLVIAQEAWAKGTEVEIRRFAA